MTSMICFIIIWPFVIVATKPLLTNIFNISKEIALELLSYDQKWFRVKLSDQYLDIFIYYTTCSIWQALKESHLLLYWSIENNCLNQLKLSWVKLSICPIVWWSTCRLQFFTCFKDHFSQVHKDERQWKWIRWDNSVGIWSKCDFLSDGINILNYFIWFTFRFKSML